MRLSDEKLSEFRAECKEVLQLRGSETEAKTASASQIPCVLWNQKVQCLVHKNSSLVRLLSHVNPVFALSSFFLKYSHYSYSYYYIVFPSTSRSCQWTFLSGFLTETVYTQLLSPTRVTSRPSH
jgi:hypothetical protein